MSSSTDAIDWPPGWSRDRLVHAEQSDLLALPDAQRQSMFDSMRTVLGEAGFKAVMAEMSANYRARLAAAEAATNDTNANANASALLKPEVVVPFLGVLRQLGLDQEGEWGWIAFVTAPKHSSTEIDTELHRRFDAETAAAFDDCASESGSGVVEAVRGAQKRFRIKWVTDAGLVGASEAEIARRYQQMQNDASRGLTTGLAHNACLVVDEMCVRSIMEAEIPRLGPRHEQRTIAYVRAVGIGLGVDGHVAPDGERLSFNVEVRALVNEFFTTIAGGLRDVSIVGASVGDGQVWCSSAGRFGIFTAT